MKGVETDATEIIERDLSFSQKLRKQRRRQLLLLLGVLVLVLIAALAVGLGVGLTRRQNQGDPDNGVQIFPVAPTAPSGNTTSFSANGTWQPHVGDTWQYQLLNPITNVSGTKNYSIYGIDLFDNSADTIKQLQGLGRRVICYFSAGSYEEWRPDAKNFTQADLGSSLAGWQGERWVNVSSPSLRSIMVKRLDIAVSKGCDGVDPDNVDGYANSNGLNLTTTDAIDFMMFLAQHANKRKLAIGLKNGAAIVPNILPYVAWQINEQCIQFNECALYQPFIAAGKPVLHVEYNTPVSAQSAISKYCNDGSTRGFSSIIKNLKLDEDEYTCPYI